MPEMRKLSETEFREYSLSGNYYRIILKVGTPLAIFAFFNCVFSILDTIMASHIGTIAVSTVSYMAQLRIAIQLLLMLLLSHAMMSLKMLHITSYQQSSTIEKKSHRATTRALNSIWSLQLPSRTSHIIREQLSILQSRDTQSRLNNTGGIIG